MSILGILVGIAAPSLRYQYWDWQARAQAQKLLGLVMRTRALALSSHGTAQLCPWDKQVGQCTAQFTGEYGSVDRDGRLHYVYVAASGIRVLNRSGTTAVMHSVTWSNQGLADRNVTYSICTPDQRVNWALVLNRIGRPRLVKHWGDCGLSNVY